MIQAAALGLLVLAVTGTAGASPPQSPTVARLEFAVQRRVDAIRREHGLPGLKPNAALATIARQHSRRMSQERFFGHRDRAGAGVADRLRAAGLGYRVVGENLAESRNADDPVAVALDGWMASRGHRANILGRNFTETGVGIWRAGTTYYVTQIFLRPS